MNFDPCFDPSPIDGGHLKPYMASLASWLVFGLGDAVEEVEVTVYWIGAPPSRHPGLAVDTRHRLTTAP